LRRGKKEGRKRLFAWGEKGNRRFFWEGKGKKGGTANTHFRQTKCGEVGGGGLLLGSREGPKRKSGPGEGKGAYSSLSPVGGTTPLDTLEDGGYNSYVRKYSHNKNGDTTFYLKEKTRSPQVG